MYRKNKFFQCSPEYCLKRGDQAPYFEAEAYYRGLPIRVNLDQYAGSWLMLFFYTADFTFVWPTELAAVAALYEQFKSLGVEVLAVSTDSIWAHKIFAQTSPSGRQVQYPLVADRSQEISRKYGVLTPEGNAPRATFLIDPEGIIQYYSVYPGPVGRNIYELLRIFQALKFTERTNLGAPANWCPGRPGVSRDWENVGKI